MKKVFIESQKSLKLIEKLVYVTILIFSDDVNIKNTSFTFVYIRNKKIEK